VLHSRLANTGLKAKNFKFFRSLRGVTLLELMVIITIGSIIMIASGYAFVSSNQNQLGQQLASQLASSLRYARSQAASLGISVSVCPASSSSLSACSTSSTAWNNGWIVFVDYNNDGIINTSGGTDTILQVFPMSGKNPNITATISGAFASYANFSTTGLPTTNKQVQMSIIPTGCTGNYGRTVYLTAAGRVSITNTSCP
jgi:Tfp pilus assembly protein FimT